MPVNPHIFRSYDIRGLIDTDLTTDTYYLLGRAYATYLAQRSIPDCPVGHDNRHSSPDFYQSFCQGLHDGGINTINLGSILSPMLYFASYHLKLRSGAIITASHLPIAHNGLKLMSGYSTALSHASLKYLHTLIEHNLFSKGVGQATDMTISSTYQSYITGCFRPQKSQKIVVDACGTNVALYYPAILFAMGHQVIVENGTLDSNFSLGTPDPLDNIVMARLSASVVKHGADLGFVYDADGDRLGCVDHTGQPVNMDQAISIYADDILSRIPGSAIVYNTLNSRLVGQVIAARHGKPVMTPTGRSFIKQAMDLHNSPFGGELSGHLFFNDQFFGHDDAIYATLRLISLLQSRQITLRDHLDSFPSLYISPEIKLGISDDIKVSHIKNVITPVVLKYDKSTVSFDTDGIRVEGADYMISIRPSQNGAYLAIKFDANTQKRYSHIQNFLGRLFAGSDIYDWSDSSNTSAIRLVQ
jgi:phosphomannomutase / phosphoglucomutase